jgi:hypothetical protein
VCVVTWLWILIVVVVVVAVVLVVLAGRGFGPVFGHRSVVLGGWLGGAIDAYEQGLALHEAVRDASRPGAAAAPDAEERWAGVERSVADLDRRLHALRAAARDPEDRDGVTRALELLAELRSAIDGRGAEPDEVVLIRMDALEASLRRLRPPERHLW